MKNQSLLASALFSFVLLFSFLAPAQNQEESSTPAQSESELPEDSLVLAERTTIRKIIRYLISKREIRFIPGGIVSFISEEEPSPLVIELFKLGYFKTRPDGSVILDFDIDGTGKKHERPPLPDHLKNSPKLDPNGPGFNSDGNAAKTGTDWDK